MSQKLVILHLIDALKKGGAERLLIDSITYLQKYHPEVKQYICTLHSNPDDLPSPVGIERINLQLAAHNFLNRIKAVKKFIKEKQVNVLHAHLLDSILFARLVHVKGIKKIFTYHNFYHDKDFAYYSKWRELAERVTFRKEYTCIHVSNEIKECVEKVTGKPDHSYVLTNFHNPSFHYLYTAKAHNSIKAVIVANLRKTKNLELAVKELSYIKELPISIDVYGEGPLRQTLEENVKASGVKLKLQGRHEITSALLSEYDLFLMTSQSEGLPLSLLEAMATGLPSLLPDHLPIFRKIAENSSVFYSISRARDLSDRLKFLLENKQCLSKLSEKAKENASAFSIVKYIDQLLTIYKN